MSVREPPLDAVVSGDELRAPQPGFFRLAVKADHLVAPGDVIGELEILGRTIPVVATKLRGLAKLPPGPALARRAVSYGDTLLTISTEVALGSSDAATSSAADAVAHGLVFKAPTSGRFYGRPGPDKPVFVTTGAEIATGSTVCLLEVMKTFHRVTYGGADVPARARVKAILVTDGADVNQGDPLLALDALA